MRTANGRPYTGNKAESSVVLFNIATTGGTHHENWLSYSANVKTTGGLSEFYTKKQTIYGIFEVLSQLEKWERTMKAF